MRWQGSIDFQKAIKIDGKPHGIEHEPTLPVWESSFIGRTVHTEDNDKLWFGGTLAWVELTPGGVGVHDHNDLYYTETEIDGFFYGEDTGKNKLIFLNVVNKPSSYTPSVHSNTAHSEVYITATGVTFENLQTNGDVGIGATQLAIGSHNHDAVYSLTSHNHASSVITYDNAISGLTAVNVKTAIDELDSNIAALNLNAATFETLNTVGDIGTGSDQVAQGDHTTPI